MLIQFSVTNFLSFRDETVLSLSTNKDNSHSENLLSYKNERVLPSVAIYGANAAGKSNLHKANVWFVKCVVQPGDKLQIKEVLMDMIKEWLNNLRVNVGIWHSLL